MKRKFMFLLIIALLLLTGCTKIDGNMDHILSVILDSKVSRVNTVSTGYQLYIPMGVIQLDDNEYNQKLKIRDTHIYLYVDIVSYFYKNNLNYVEKDGFDYFYSEIDYNDKKGYIGIKKIDEDNYFVKIVYNYSKIEFYSSYDDLSFITANSLIILNSIKYNDSLIQLELSDDYKNYNEVKYELDKPEGSKSTFSQYLQEFVDNNEVEDDDVIDLPDGE